MKNIILALFVVVSTSVTYAQDKTVASAIYNRGEDTIDIWVYNNCREVEVNVGECARSYPGKLTIVVRETTETQICNRNLMNLVRVDAKTLGCRDAQITVSDEAGGNFYTFVPDLPAQTVQ